MYQPIKKKYSLSRSYFKLCYGDQPRDPYQCLDYYHEHGERPFNPYGNDQKEIIYNMFSEYQKRNTSDMKFFDQFYTPLNTAKRMVTLLQGYMNGETQSFCDPCCGWGVLSSFLEGGCEMFDIYQYNVDFVSKTQTGRNVYKSNFTDVDTKHKFIISNPPFKPLPEFLEWVHKTLTDDGVAALLLPAGYLEKERPKALVEKIKKLDVIHRERVQEKFETTNVICDIYVIRKST